MSNDVGYEMAWKILKNTIEQLKESQTYAKKSASNFPEFDQAKGEVLMAEQILEEMELMEGQIAAMRGDDGDA